MTSELERDNAYTWYSPRFEKIGVLGQPNGPSLDLVRVAKASRFEFKAEEAKRKAERASLSAVTPTPRLVGSTTFSSGIERPQSWADPKPTAALPIRSTISRSNRKREPASVRRLAGCLERLEARAPIITSAPLARGPPKAN